MSAIDFGPKVEREVENIEESEDLSDENRALLLRYKRDLKVEGLSKGRIHKLLVHTRVLAERLGGTAFGDATEDDLKGLVEWVEDRDLASSTKRDYREVLKRFYKWLNGGECPDKAEWIRTTRKRKNRKLPEKMLTEDDVQNMIDAAKNPRDRAFLALLWETGARIGELLDLKVGSFEDRKHGQKVVIRGKTGPRRLPLVSSTPFLNRWLSDHPKKDDSSAPLWCKLNDGRERITYEYARKLLRRIEGRAGVDKPVNPHHFRHSRATYLANHLTEAQLCQYFGWVQGSDRPADYVHLSGRDLDAHYDHLHGFEDEPGPEKSGLSPQQCPRCDAMNEPEAKFCQKCGLALDEEVADRLQEDEEIAEELYTEDIKAEGSIKELVEEMVERRLKEILGEDYRP